MKKFIILILVSVLFLPGCSGYKTQRLQENIDVLTGRVDSLEKRQQYVETKVEVRDITYAETDTISVTEKTVAMSNRDIQSALKEAGYYDGAIDGKLGPKSRKAIREFQADRGLKIDGVAGTNTKKALLQYMAQ